MSAVTQNFATGLKMALTLDGSVKTLGFSDGTGTSTGRILVDVNVLWIIDTDRLVHTHSHGLNYIAYDEAITMIFFQSDVPENAAIAANAYIDVDNVQYRIETAVLENEIYQLDLHVFRTR